MYKRQHYACLLQWDNIYYQPPTQEYINPKTTVRVGLVQWQMRSYKTLDDPVSYTHLRSILDFLIVTIQR